MEREVTQSRKNADGDILALCKPGVPWSPRSKSDAIRDIETRTYCYVTVGPRGQRSEIHVVDGPNGKYLRTDWDNTSRNNLDDLPHC